MANELLDNTNATDCAGELGNIRLLPTFFDGHCYYVAKCLRGEAVDGDVDRRQIGGIELPQCFRYNHTDKEGNVQTTAEVDAMGRTCIVTILAVGPNVGKKCSKAHAKKHERPRRVDMDLKIGDMVLCPNRSLGIQTSPLCSYEFFIEEYVPRVKLEKGSGNE